MEELGSMETIKWYERDFTLEDAMGMIQGSMKSAVRNYVAVGFYLKAIRDRKLFEEAGYRNFEEFVRDKYDKDKGWASRCIKVNDKLSKDGNTPLLADEYKDYNVSQLVELAAMTEEQRAQVTPKTSVREMKQIRNPKPEEPEKVVTLQLPEKTIYHFTDGDRNIDNAYGATMSEIVKAYLAKGLQDECTVVAWGDTYKVLRRPDITVFYTDAGETLFDVENSRLEKEYQYWYGSKGVEGQVESSNQDGDVTISQQKESQTESEDQPEPDPEDEIIVDTSTCPPNNSSSCRRQEWGTSPKEQEAGHKECVKCWEDWKKSERIRRAENQTVKAETGKEADKEEPEPGTGRIEPSERGCITGLSKYDNCVCCGDNGVECCAQCHEPCNGRCGWIEEQQENQEQEETSGFHQEEGDDRATYVHEQYRLQKEYLYPFAEKVIRENKDWFLKDYMGRVLNVETSEPQLKELLGANNEGRQCCFVIGEKAVVICLFKDRIDVSYFDSNEVLHPEGTCEWFYFAAAVQAMWNEVVLEDKGKEAVDSGAGKTEEVMEPEVIDVEFTEVEEPEGGELTDLQIARRELEMANNLLNKCLKDVQDETNPIIRGMKIKVAALASLVCDMDDIENPPPKPEQPELPILRNNDQRAAFVDAYETWPLWIETMETGERYYRYDLPDGTSMVVKVYHAMLFDYKAFMAHEERFSEGWGKQEYYLLRPGKFFKDCEANRSALIEKLKEIQKKSDMPEKGTKMYSVHEHLYYVKGRSGPLREYCVYEGIVKEIRKVGYTELCLKAKDADGHEQLFFYPIKEIGKSVFYTPGEAALLARDKTEQYEKTWARMLEEPLRRSWEQYLVEEKG